MAQRTIFEKLRHHSDKDFTVAIGKGEEIYFTFRNDVWKNYTTTDYLAIDIVDGCRLKFREGHKGDGFKLTVNKNGKKGADWKHLKFKGWTKNPSHNKEIYKIIKPILTEDGGLHFNRSDIIAPKQGDPVEIFGAVPGWKEHQKIPVEVSTLTEMKKKIADLETRVAQLESDRGQKAKPITGAPDNWREELIKTIKSL